MALHRNSLPARLRERLISYSRDVRHLIKTEARTHLCGGTARTFSYLPLVLLIWRGRITAHSDPQTNNRETKNVKRQNRFPPSGVHACLRQRSGRRSRLADATPSHHHTPKSAPQHSERTVAPTAGPTPQHRVAHTSIYALSRPTATTAPYRHFEALHGSSPQPIPAALRPTLVSSASMARQL